MTRQLLICALSVGALGAMVDGAAYLATACVVAGGSLGIAAAGARGR